MTFELNISNTEAQQFRKFTLCALQKAVYVLLFLVPLFLANYSCIFYAHSLFILAGSISKMHLHTMDAHLISASLCSECFNFHK